MELCPLGDDPLVVSCLSHTGAPNINLILAGRGAHRGCSTNQAMDTSAVSVLQHRNTSTRSFVAGLCTGNAEDITTHGVLSC